VAVSSVEHCRRLAVLNLNVPTNPGPMRRLKLQPIKTIKRAQYRDTATDSESELQCQCQWLSSSRDYEP
jgi:hypothetical protein